MGEITAADEGQACVLDVRDDAVVDQVPEGTKPDGRNGARRPVERRRKVVNHRDNAGAHIACRANLDVVAVVCVLTGANKFAAGGLSSPDDMGIIHVRHRIRRPMVADYVARRLRRKTLEITDGRENRLRRARRRVWSERGDRAVAGWRVRRRLEGHHRGSAEIAGELF